MCDSIDWGKKKNLFTHTHTHTHIFDPVIFILGRYVKETVLNVVENVM